MQSNFSKNESNSSSTPLSTTRTGILSTRKKQKHISPAINVKKSLNPISKPIQRVCRGKSNNLVAMSKSINDNSTYKTRINASIGKVNESEIHENLALKKNVHIEQGIFDNSASKKNSNKSNKNYTKKDFGENEDSVACTGRPTRRTKQSGLQSSSILSPSLPKYQISAVEKSKKSKKYSPRIISKKSFETGCHKEVDPVVHQKHKSNNGPASFDDIEKKIFDGTDIRTLANNASKKIKKCSSMEVIKSCNEGSVPEKCLGKNKASISASSRTRQNKKDTASKSFEEFQLEHTESVPCKVSSKKFKKSAKISLHKSKQASVSDADETLTDSEGIQTLKASKEASISFDDIEKRIFDGIDMKSDIFSVSSKRKAHISSEIKRKSSLGIKKDFSKNQHCSVVTPPINQNCRSSSKSIVKTKNIKLQSVNRRVPTQSPKLKKSKIKPVPALFNKEKFESSSEGSDWEEVDELSEILKSSDGKSNDCVQIELEAGNVLWGARKRKRRSHQELIEDYFRKEANKSIKEVHENMHKTHLLCLLSHGMHINSLAGNDILLSSALSLIPKQYFSPKRLDLNHLEKFLNWFYKLISISAEPANDSEDTSIIEALKKRFETKSAQNNKELVIMFVITARAIGMTARFVQSLTPISWKPLSCSLIKPIKNQADDITEAHLSSNGAYTSGLNQNLDKKLKSRKMLSSDSDSDSKAGKKIKGKKLKNGNSSNDDDDDFEKNLKFNRNGACTSKRKGKNLVDSKEGKKKQKTEELKEWVEVFVEEEEKWIPVDLTRNKIHCAGEIEARSSNMAYVTAFNSDHSVKDVTKRYLSSWLSCKDKIRCDGDWWIKSLKPFAGRRDRRDKEEDKELETYLIKQPLPKTINEFKNHPLYALQRHLLKFEAIYPPDETPIGYIKKEPVFRRDSVKNVNGRENWIKEAKTVRVGEEPYKLVKARPKWDRGTGQIINKDQPLELFGEWQVEDYEPPIAKNGKVPRNEYGNVDLFKPCMLPKGCVHLPINGLSRLARKLEIDCAPAVTGFDFHSGSCHPTLDGFIVCEEFKDVIIDAWNQDQQEQKRKEEEKRLKRIYDNWKKLIYGITLKDRIKEKYGVTTDSSRNKKESTSAIAKENKKKITQDDLNTLPSSTITHPVVKLTIDFTSSITGREKNRNKRTMTATAKEGQALASSLGASDDEEMNEDEKKEKLQNILRWKPKSDGHQDSDPYLSDDSEDGTASRPIRNSSATSPPITEYKKNNVSSKKSSRKSTSFLNKAVNSVLRKGKRHENVTIDDIELSTDSESEDSTNENPIANNSLGKRRSLRDKGRKSNILYKDSTNSGSDISIGESDTGDASYDPND